MNHAPRKTPRPLKGSLPIALLRARESVMSRFRPLLAARGFTEQQWRVLRVLDEFGPLDPSEIAERSVIMPPSMTRILKTLEDKGMVVRTQHPHDRRRYIIDLTEVSRRAISAATPASNQVYAEIEALYGREKLEQLLDLLEELARSVGDPTLQDLTQKLAPGESD
ncbi:MAG: homoprotocatechuate degradation operon regulator HpaR [Magnetospiraceae bacterium]